MGISPRHQGEAPEWADANCRAVLEAAPDAMVVVNRAGEIVAANPQAQKLYGYSREHLIGRVVESLIPARLRDRHRQHRQNFFANPETQARQVLEIFAVRSDASEIPVDVSLSLLTIGTETFAISAIRDATERRRIEELKRAEAVLRESGERFRLAAQAGKMYAYEWDVATDMVMRSEEHVSVLGFSQPRRLTRLELLARVHPEDRPLFVGSVGHLTPRNPTTQISYRVSCPDGSVVWLEKSARGFFDDQGKLLRVIGMVANITERKRAEEALRESEARYEQLAEQSRTTNWEVDPQGLFTYISHVSQASWGYSPDEVVGQMHFYDIHPEEGREAFKAAVFAAVERKQSFRDVVHAVETKDGRIAWGSVNGIPMLNPDGTLRGYRGSCTDITERKRAEAALANVSRKLIEAQEQERARIGRELHDDIGQRLAMLAIALEQLQQESLALPAEVRNHVGKLLKQTSEIAADIQSLSHELHSAKLQYLGIAAAMRGFCQQFGEQQKVEIGFQSHDLPSPVLPDTALCLFRVLQEALHNSVKHSGVRHIEVRLWGTSGEIQLTVKDSGAGFDREAAKTSRGLGLISMEERLKLVDGTLSIESQPKSGTTIHARVPLRSGSDSMRVAG